MVCLEQPIFHSNILGLSCAFPSICITYSYPASTHTFICTCSGISISSHSFLSMFTKKKPLQVKKTKVTVTSSAKPTSSTRPLSAALHRSSASQPKPRTTTLAAPRPPHSSAHTQSERRTHNAGTPPISAPKRKRPASQAPDFGTGDESSEANDDEAELEREAEVKRRKQREVREVFKNRRVRSQAAFEEDGDLSAMVHAAEIPGRDAGTKYEVYFQGLEEGGEVEVQYPSLGRERYVLRGERKHAWKVNGSVGIRLCARRTTARGMMRFRTSPR